MELMTVLIPPPRYYNPDVSGWFEEWAADKLVDRFQQAAIYVKFYGGGASVTTRLITKEDRKRTAGGPT
jgi:hypothetical protein